MGVSEQVGGIYSKIEEGFFGFMDFLADKGLPVYAVIDPIEERGIPFFPVAIASIVLIAFLAYGLLFLSSSTATITLSITDKTGAALSAVTIKAFDDKSGLPLELSSDTFRDGQQFSVPLGIGGKVRLEASKAGYLQSAPATVFLNSPSVTASIRLDKETRIVEGKVRLVDDETGDAISGAQVIARFSDNASVECLEGDDGVYTCPGASEGSQTALTIKQPNYEDKSVATKFASDAVNELSLVPKASAATGNSSIVVRAFDEATKERVGNFTLRIYDAKNNELISEVTETDGDGEQIERVAKGTQARIVVEKSDYLTYDSSEEGGTETLRDDEITRNVYLRAGTNSLTAGVVDAAGKPLSEIGVALFGEAVFDGLDAARIYYVSAWDEKYLPSSQRVDLGRSNRATLTLERGVASNSGSLTVYAVNENSTVRR